MRPIPILVCAAFLAAAIAMVASAEPKGRAASGVFRFIGFTDDATNALPDTIDGGQGMLAMHALCQDDFGVNARMCTSKDFGCRPMPKHQRPSMLGSIPSAPVRRPATFPESLKMPLTAADGPILPACPRLSNLTAKRHAATATSLGL